MISCTRYDSAVDNEGCTEANCRSPICVEQSKSSHPWSYVSERRSGYVVVEKLAFMGECQGAFSWGEGSQKLGVRQPENRYGNYAALHTNILGVLVRLFVLCSLCGIALLVPGVLGMFNKADVLQSPRSLLKYSGSRHLILERTSLQAETNMSTTRNVYRLDENSFVPKSDAQRENMESISGTLAKPVTTSRWTVPAENETADQGPGCGESCGQRIRFAAQHAFEGKIGSCLRSLMAVKSGGVCMGCTLWNVGCQEQDMRKPLDEAKVVTEASTVGSATTTAPQTMPEWAHAAVATPPTASLRTHNCESGFFNCVYSWTIEKKRWCTTYSQRVCPLYDCNSGFDKCNSQWSDAQKKWCQTNRVDRECAVLTK